MKESYPELFPSGKFRMSKFFKWKRVVTPLFLNNNLLVLLLVIDCLILLIKLFTIIEL